MGAGLKARRQRRCAVLRSACATCANSVLLVLCAGCGTGRFNELVAGAVRDRVLQMSYRHVNLHRGTEHPIRDTKPLKIRNRGRYQRHTLSSCYKAKAELDERPSMRRLQSNQTYSRDRRPGAKRTLPVQLSRHWADRLTGRAEVATFQGVGHLVFLESLDAVTRVGAFMNGGGA